MARDANVHAFDANLMLRESAAGALSATETVPATGTAIWGGNYAVQMTVPAVNNAADTLKVEVKLASTVGGTYNTVAATPARAAVTAGEIWVINFTVPAGKWFVKITNTVTGATPNFGTAIAGVIPAVKGQDYDRADHYA